MRGRGGPYVPLRNSRPRHARSAVAGKNALRVTERVEVSVVVPPQAGVTKRAAALRELAHRLPRERQGILRPTELRQLCEADPQDLAAVVSYARGHHLEVQDVSPSKRRVVLSGSVSAMQEAFRVEMAVYSHNGTEYLSHGGPIHVPARLGGKITAVLGLDHRPLAGRHAIGARLPAGKGTDPRRIAQLYRFPPGWNGRGQCIGIIELGGGFYRSDLAGYFHRPGLQEPRITVEQIGGQTNNPASVQSIRNVLEQLEGKAAPAAALSPPEQDALRNALFTIETNLDIQLAGSLANAAHLVVFFAPNSSRGKYEAMLAALNSRHRPSVISCSWGRAEDQLDGQFVSAFDQLLQDAALRGITVCCSSGDDGAGGPGKPQVNFPASSPHVLACGGTHLDPQAPQLESVWKEKSGASVLASTGGVSRWFRATPLWQAAAGIKRKTGRSGRGVPDVASKADLRNGFQILAGGFHMAMGGTSAAAPLWAALIARLNQALRTRVGYLTPLLYSDRFRLSTRDITRGNNGRFRARRGWDACTGLGRPIGSALLKALAGF